MPITPDSTDHADLVTVYKTGSVDRDEHPSLAATLLEGRTQLSSETGYLMKFGDESHRGLTPFDIASLRNVPAYPLPQPALESLPANVRAELEQNGAVQMYANYDSSTHRFDAVVLAWEDQDFLERIAELVASGLTLHEAVDWVTIEEAERYTTEQWAAIRDVTVDAVRSNVNAAREQLLADRELDRTE